MQESSKSLQMKSFCYVGTWSDYLMGTKVAVRRAVHESGLGDLGASEIPILPKTSLLLLCHPNHNVSGFISDTKAASLTLSVARSSCSSSSTRSRASSRSTSSCPASSWPRVSVSCPSATTREGAISDGSAGRWRGAFLTAAPEVKGCRLGLHWLDLNGSLCSALRCPALLYFAL